MITENPNALPQAELYLQPDPETPDSPHAVLKGTSFSFDVFFSHSFSRNDGLAWYLDKHTVPFIDSAVKALPILNHLEEEITPDELELVQEVVGAEGSPTVSGRAVEKLSLSRIIFSAMPDMFTSDHYPTGFSRRGILTPPSTLSEFTSRLQEMRTVVKGITDGDIQSGQSIHSDPRIFRTYAFFHVGSQIQSPVEIASLSKSG